MTPRPAHYQANFTAGELDILVQSRTDIKSFYAGAAFMQNAEPFPQGGFRVSGGYDVKARVRNQLQNISVSGATLSMPNGGDPAVCFDGNTGTSTSTAALGTAGVIAQVVFPAPQAVSAVDVYLIKAQTAAQNGLMVEYSLDGSVWVRFGARQALALDPYSVRCALAPNEKITARWWRLAIDGAPAPVGVVTLAEMGFLLEGTALSPVRIRKFHFNRLQSYDFVMTSGNIDVHNAENGAYLASILFFNPAAALPKLRHAQSSDTFLAFHPEYPPVRIQRMGGIQQWVADYMPLKNLPLVDYGAVYSNGVTALVDIQLNGFNTTNDALFIKVNGREETAGISLASTPEAQIKNALEALAEVSQGLIVTAISSTKYRIEFAGAGNEGDAWVLSCTVPNSSTASASVSKIRKGVVGGEVIMSGTRGYPAAAEFFSGRLVLAGFKSKPSSVMMSTTTDPYDYNTLLESPAGGILFTLDARGDVITHVVAGRFLQIFTDQGEHFCSNREFNKQQPFNFVRSSQNGVNAEIPIVENDGASLFVQNNQASVFENAYNDGLQSYAAANVTAMASGVVRNIRDAALRRSVKAQDGSLYLLNTQDGELRVGVLMRGQDVTAFCRYKQQGTIEAVNVNSLENITLATRHTVASVPNQFFEMRSEAHHLHNAISITLSSLGRVVTGLSSLEGASVWALADGFYTGPYVVSGGQITLNEPALNITVGRWLPPVVTTLPLPRNVDEKRVIQRKARIYAVTLDVLETTSLAIAANGGAIQEVDLTVYGITQNAPLFNPFSGKIRICGIEGYVQDAQLTITQTRPGKLTVRSVSVEARI